MNNRKKIHPTNQRLESFYLLFLSSGYTDGEEIEFKQTCKNISKQIVKITPFNEIKESFAIYMQFEPNTNYGIIKNAYNNYEINNPIELVNAIERYETDEASIGTIDNADLWLNIAEENKIVCMIVKSDNSINDIGKNVHGTMISKFNATDENLQNKLDCMKHVVIIPEIPMPRYVNQVENIPPTNIEYLEDWEQVNVENGLEKCQTVILVKQIAHIFNLANESEEKHSDDVKYPEYAEENPEPAASNVTALKTELGTEISDVENLKWNYMIPIAKRKQAIIPKTHPEIDLNKTNPDKYSTIVSESKESIVKLGHPNERNSSNELVQFDYVHREKARKLLTGMDGSHLIEGANNYPLKIWRSEPECIMRTSGYVKKVKKKNSAGENIIKFVPNNFCKVCQKVIRQKLTGIWNYNYFDTRFSTGPTNVKRKLPTNTASDIADWIEYLQKPNSVLKKLKVTSKGSLRFRCIGSTHHRFETFFTKNDELNRRYAASFNLNLSNSEIEEVKTIRKGFEWTRGMSQHDLPDISSSVDENYHGKNFLNYPKGTRMNTDHMNAIWMTEMPSLIKHRSGVANYACLGAPGAIAYAGFGTLANTFYSRSEENSDGEIINYPVAINLRGNDAQPEIHLDNDRIVRGSLMQIWPSQSAYEGLLRWYHGTWKNGLSGTTETEKENNFLVEIEPDIARRNSLKINFKDAGKKFNEVGITRRLTMLGHSLFYMGKKNGKHIFADQSKTDANLTGRTWGKYKFWIAAQWFNH